MAAEWELIGYRVDVAKLYAVVGGNDKKLRTAVLKAAKGRKYDDDRLAGTPEELVDEILSGKVVKGHATSYRIMFESFLDAGAQRLSFDFDKQAKGMKSILTYALKDQVGKVLKGCKLPTLGKGWDRDTFAWPWKSSPRVGWPAVAYWSADEVAKAAQDVTKAPRPTPESVAPLMDDGDEGFAEDNFAVVVALRELVKAARGTLAKPRPPAGGKDGLLVYYDGEQ